MTRDVKCHGLGNFAAEGEGIADRLDVKVGKLILITPHVTYQYGPASEEGGNFYECFLSTFNLYLSLLLATDPRLSTVGYSLGMFAKLQKAVITFVVFFCLSVRGTTRFPLDGFSRNFIFEYFFLKNLSGSSFITI